ncbi:glycosyltransferase family 87 protein [Bryobacter aggregatus]|uniref:glycosyltransferase family 87 protein n=1 Tax=Bryobacter aggregatus TaxID=360054 RepID=UPI00138E0A1C|nr:glycosyltransferase family 87 protein [Bryobacter aggregatus]
MRNTPSTFNSFLRWAGVGLVVLISVVFYSAMAIVFHKNTLVNDFLGFYAAGAQLNAGDGARLHDHRVQKEYQEKVQPAMTVVVPFPRPRYYAEIFRPLAKFPEEQALWIWQGVQILGLLGTWWLLVLRYQAEILMLTAFFFPLPAGIAHGQDTGWMTFLAALSVYLYQSGYAFWSGAILALCLAKWHLLLLVPVAMVLGRQWALLQGFLGVSVLTLGLDFALDGVAGWESYIALLRRQDLDRMTPGLTLMPNLQGLFANLGIGSLWWVGLIFVLGCFAVCALRLPWPKALLAAQLGAILAVPHSFQYDLAFTLFPLVVLLSEGATGAVKWAGFLLLVPPLYLSTAFPPPWAGILALIPVVLLTGMAMQSAAGLLQRKRAQAAA